MTLPGPETDATMGRLARAIGPLARRRVPLGPLCTYKVGGPAEVFVEAGSVDDIVTVSKALASCDPDSILPVLVVGKGSNLLVSDSGFPGLVLHLGDGFSSIDLDRDRFRVRAGAMALLPVVARRSAAAGLSGFEWAVGVPGSIGGAVRMNAGGHGSDMAASLASVNVVDLGVDGEPVTLSPGDLALGYRTSALSGRQVVLEATLQLEVGDPDRSNALISDIVAWRRANQPGGQNAGSVFANPTGDSAGRLIDSLGLKGLRIGTAEVSTKHANFIQADPGGSADDVFALIGEVQRRVREATSIDLRPENRLVGFGSDSGSARGRGDDHRSLLPGSADQ